MIIRNPFLLIGGALSFIAASLHMFIIIMGPSWYLFFGAGKQMATMAAQGQWQPTVITTSIALMLATWGSYGFSAAGLMRPLPWMRTMLCIATGIYLLRGVAGLAFALLADESTLVHNGVSYMFVIASSVMCCMHAGCYAIGLQRLRRPAY